MSLPSGQGHRSSRLLDFLRAAPHTGSRVGFSARAEAPRRLTALIAQIDTLDAALIASAKAAGADAIEAHVTRTQDLDGLATIVRTAGLPVGLLIDASLESSVASSAADAGIDWLRLPFESTIRSLQWEQPARVLTIPLDIDLRVIGALNGMPVDVVVLDGVPEAGDELSFAQILRVRTLSEVLRKPLLARVALGIPPDAAQAVEHLGVDALLVPLLSRSTALLEAYSTAIARHS